jgi:hypothetical protein
MAGSMSFASITDAFSVAMEQWSTQHRVFVVETFFRNSDCWYNTEYFTSISILLIMEKFLATVHYSYG